MLKTLLMVYYARLTDVEPNKFKLPAYAFKLFYEAFPRPLGLYFPTLSNGDNVFRFATENATTVALKIVGDVVCGAEITLGGLRMVLVINPAASAFAEFERSHTYRPKNLLFFKSQEVYCVGFAFEHGSDRNISLSHGDPNGELPSGILEQKVAR